MKNKQLTYFLILVVVGLWGLIIYRIFSAVGNSDDDIPPPVAKPVKEAFNDYAIPKDTTKLLLDYRDPFGLTKQKDTAVKITRSSVSKTATAIEPGINWPFITYSGYIRNPASKKLVALVTMNGQNLTLLEGETKNHVKLLKNLRDSIKVSFEGKTKFIVIKSAAL